jgi:hypothetical protein
VLRYTSSSFFIAFTIMYVGCTQVQSGDITETGGSLITCPAEVECHCQRDNDCHSGTCSPVNTCTLFCLSDSDCPRIVAGESCLGLSPGRMGMCGVVCEQNTDDGGCEPAGMPSPHASCINVTGTYVCGYSRSQQG